MENIEITKKYQKEIRNKDYKSINISGNFLGLGNSGTQFSTNIIINNIFPSKKKSFSVIVISAIIFWHISFLLDLLVTYIKTLL